MPRALLGRTGIEVSRLCFGTLTISPLQQNMTPEACIPLFECALERGIYFFDTAELYETYAHLRQVLRMKEDAVIATKSYAYDRQGAEASVEKALRELGRDYIDLFLLHEQESVHTIRGHFGAVERLLEYRQKGVIRAVGLSTHHVAAVQGALLYPELEIVHPIFNRWGLGVADGDEKAMKAAVASAYLQGKGIFAMKPLGGGHHLPESREAFDYVLQSPYVHAVAVGMQSVEEILVNSTIFSGQEPDPALVQKLSVRQRRLMIHDWCEGCGKCVARCQQGALRIAKGKAVVDGTRCVLCGYCASVCPQFCIKVI